MVHKLKCVVTLVFQPTNFRELFWRQCLLTGHAFFRAPRCFVRKLAQAMSLAKHLPVVDEDGNQWPWRILLPEGYHQRLLGYDRLLKRLRLKPKHIVNITQKAKYFKIGSKMSMPCLLTRTSTIWSYVHQRLLLPVERLEVMGIGHFVPGRTDCTGVEELYFAEQLSDKELNEVCGNSMVHIAVGSVLLFALMTTHKLQ